MPTNPVDPNINTGLVAAMLGVSNVQISQLKNLVDDPLPFVGKKGREFLFDIHAVHEWSVRRRIREHYRGTKTDEEDTAKVLNFTEEKSRLTKAQADEKELILAQKRGELLPLDVIDEVLGFAVDELRSTADAIPAELGRSCPELSASAMDVVKRVLARFLNGLADKRFSPSDLETERS